MLEIVFDKNQFENVKAVERTCLRTIETLIRYEIPRVDNILLN